MVVLSNWTDKCVRWRLRLTGVIGLLLEVLDKDVAVVEEEEEEDDDELLTLVVVIVFVEELLLFCSSIT